MDFTGEHGTIWGREPTAILFLVNAVVVAVTTFGLDLSQAQIGGILLVVTAILGVVTRASVYSPDTVASAK